MSDNTTITPGAGASVAADNVGGVLHQRVKIAWGIDGAAVDASATDPFPVAIESGTLSLTGEDHIGEVGGNTKLVTPTITVNTAVYVANDCVGGKITLSSAMRVSAGSGVLQNVTIVDLAGQGVTLNFWLFNADPSAGTYTDHAALTLNSTDLAKCICAFQVASTEYISASSKKFVSKNLGYAVAAVGSADLYLVMQTTGTPDWVASTDLKVSLGFLRD